jgi:Ca2+-binding RTX toxin-like protein
MGSTIFTVHVVNDTTGPTLAATANKSVAASSAAGAVVTFDQPAATDTSGVDASSRSCAPASGSTFAVGVTTVTCTAKDTFGTAATSTFTVTVAPFVAPTPTTPAPPAGPTDQGETVLGQELADLIHALGGDDVIRGLFGDDVLYGDGGNDQLFGDDGADKLFGGDGNDRLVGGAGNDRLNGGLGSDVLLGGPGNDLISARGTRKDVIDCGAGNDIASVDKLDVVRNCEHVFRK